ncbi:MAG: DegT/DnrJ/EryC1/StrS family aminotransferase [Saprospiraceae bacterium]|nr:DegT/DnrJ/EryC1/StrS family aminotransferase [Saprospiraceae bacterium]
MKEKIQMVDLHGQYMRIKAEIDTAIQQVLDETVFINGPQVGLFAAHMQTYLGCNYVIPCANGTDALQIALMSLDLEEGDEVIIPAFTYAATAEVIALLKLKPVMVDVNEHNFNLDLDELTAHITPRTRAIVPVHLFGQGSDMGGIMEIAQKHGLYVVEDNAQALGADWFGKEGRQAKLGTIGHIGCTSFFPSKNLGCYGDGGAIMTNDATLAAKIKMIANHGQSKKYHHELIGCNSRLDTLQAAILDVKLKYLDEYAQKRNDVAAYYDHSLAGIDGIQIPARVSYSNHVFHQYTLRIEADKRDALKDHLQHAGIPSMIYYPIPLYRQQAYRVFTEGDLSLGITELLCREVLSLPVHTEMEEAQLDYISSAVKQFFS